MKLYIQGPALVLALAFGIVRLAFAQEMPPMPPMEQPTSRLLLSPKDKGDLAVQSYRVVSQASVVIRPAPRVIKIGWGCSPVSNPEFYSTGLVGSTNLVSWYNVVSMPYATTNVYSATNRFQCEFFRAWTWFRVK